jgi:hypothetical protein
MAFLSGTKYQNSLRQHVNDIKEQYERDLRQGYGVVYLWPSLEQKYPHIAKEWGWQFSFVGRALPAKSSNIVISKQILHYMTLLIALEVSFLNGLDIIKAAAST